MQGSETTEEEDAHSADGSEVSASIAVTSNNTNTQVNSVGNTSESTEQQQNISSISSEKREFELDDKATAFFDPSSKITAFTAVVALLPQSRAAGQMVSASRPFSMCERMERKGRNQFTVATPVRIDQHRTLLFVGADWSKQPRGIIFDERDNSVSFSNKAVTSTIQDMSGDTTFAPALLATMDTACAAFLHGRVLGPTDNTKEGEFIGFWLFITCLVIFTFDYCKFIFVLM